MIQRTKSNRGRMRRNPGRTNAPTPRHRLTPRTNPARTRRHLRHRRTSLRPAGSSRDHRSRITKRADLGNGNHSHRRTPRPRRAADARNPQARRSAPPPHAKKWNRPGSHGLHRRHRRRHAHNTRTRRLRLFRNNPRRRSRRRRNHHLDRRRRSKNRRPPPSPRSPHAPRNFLQRSRRASLLRRKSPAPKYPAPSNRRRRASLDPQQLRARKTRNKNFNSRKIRPQWSERRSRRSAT